MHGILELVTLVSYGVPGMNDGGIEHSADSAPAQRAGFARVLWSSIAAISTLVGAFSFVYFWGLENGKDLGETKIKARVQAERESVERELADRIQRTESDRDIAQQQRKNAMIELDKVRLIADTLEKDKQIAEETLTAGVAKMNAANRDRDRLAQELGELKKRNDALSAQLSAATTQLAHTPPPAATGAGGAGPAPQSPPSAPPTQQRAAAVRKSIGALQVSLMSSTLSGRTATLVFTLKNTSKQTLNIVAWPPTLNFGADGTAEGDFTVNGRRVPNRASGGLNLQPDVEYTGEIVAPDIPAGVALIRSLEMRVDVGKQQHTFLLTNQRMTSPQ